MREENVKPRKVCNQRRIPSRKMAVLEDQSLVKEREELFFCVNGLFYS